LLPGSVLPLPNVGVCAGAVSAIGRLSVALEYVEENLSADAATSLRDQALTWLREG